MRVIKPDLLAKAAEGENPLGEIEAFFVEMWYSMTHQKSLDSYRVRCMNSRMIIRELAEELRIGLIKPIEIKNLAAEAIDCLSNDPVVIEAFDYQWKIIQPFLETPPQADEKNRNNEKGKELVFLVNDFHATLEKDGYLHYRVGIQPF